MQNKNKKLKILFLTDNFPPEVNAPATRTYEHCREWVRQGVDVTVITGFPNFPIGKVFDGYKNKLYQKEIVDGIKIVRVWTYITANKGFFKRTLDYFSFAISSFIAGLFVETDVIIATSPQFFTTWSAFLLSKIKRKPWIFEVRDLWPESIVAVGAIKNEKLIKFLEKIELALYRDASKVVVVTKAFMENLAQRGIERQKIVYVPNGVNLDFFSPTDKDKNLLKELGLENKFVAGYIGTHGMAHGLETIVKAAKVIDDRNIHFLFVGEGANKNSLLELSRKLGVSNVTFLPMVPKPHVKKYISLLDVGIVHLKKKPLFKTVIPSKIFEFAAMGKPILLGVDGEARKIIEKYSAGLFFEPENEIDLVEKLKVLRQNLELYKAIREGALKLAIDFDRKVLAQKMLQCIQDVV